MGTSRSRLSPLKTETESTNTDETMKNSLFPKIVHHEDSLVPDILKQNSSESENSLEFVYKKSAKQPMCDYRKSALANGKIDPISALLNSVHKKDLENYRYEDNTGLFTSASSCSRVQSRQLQLETASNTFSYQGGAESSDDDDYLRTDFFESTSEMVMQQTGGTGSEHTPDTDRSTRSRSYRTTDSDMNKRRSVFHHLFDKDAIDEEAEDSSSSSSDNEHPLTFLPEIMRTFLVIDFFHKLALKHKWEKYKESVIERTYAQNSTFVNFEEENFSSFCKSRAKKVKERVQKFFGTNRNTLNNRIIVDLIKQNIQNDMQTDWEKKEKQLKMVEKQRCQRLVYLGFIPKNYDECDVLYEKQKKSLEEQIAEVISFLCANPCYEKKMWRIPGAHSHKNGRLNRSNCSIESLGLDDRKRHSITAAKKRSMYMAEKNLNKGSYIDVSDDTSSFLGRLEILKDTRGIKFPFSWSDDLFLLQLKSEKFTKRMYDLAHTLFNEDERMNDVKLFDKKENYPDDDTLDENFLDRFPYQ